jgi:hypothetical protein
MIRDDWTSSFLLDVFLMPYLGSVGPSIIPVMNLALSVIILVILAKLGLLYFEWKITDDRKKLYEEENLPLLHKNVNQTI